MSWYHVGDCDCPSGCCSCSTSTRKEYEAVVYDPLKNELYLWDVTGTSMNIESHCNAIGDVFICMLI